MTNPFDFSETEKEELKEKFQLLKNKRFENLSLEEQRIVIQFNQAFREEKFTLAKEEKEKKSRKGKKEEVFASMDAIYEIWKNENPEAVKKPKKKKKPTKKSMKERISALQIKEFIEGLEDCEKEELIRLKTELNL